MSNSPRWALIATPTAIYNEQWMEIYVPDVNKFIKERGGDVARYVVETSHGTQRFIRWATPSDDPEAERRQQRQHR